MPQSTANARARAFLAAYRVCASVTMAAAAVPMDKSLHYRWLKQSAAYAKDFADAKEQAADALEDEAVERATVGVFEPTVYQGEFTYPMVERVDPETGEVTTERATAPVGVYKKSDGLLMMLLKGFKPAKYSQRISAELSGPDGGPIPITNPGLASLTDDELDALLAIAEKLTLLGGNADRGDSGGKEAPAA